MPGKSLPVFYLYDFIVFHENKLGFFIFFVLDEFFPDFFSPDKILYRISNCPSIVVIIYQILHLKYSSQFKLL